MDGWIKKLYIYMHMHVYIRVCTHTHTHNGILFSHLKKEGNLTILPCGSTQMDLEGIMLSEINQRKINTICYHLYVESKF